MSGIREKLRLFLAFLTSSKGIALLFSGRELQAPKYHPPLPQQRPPISRSFSPPPPPPPVLFLGSAAKKALRPSFHRPYLHVWLSVCGGGGGEEKGGLALFLFPCPSPPPSSSTFSPFKSLRHFLFLLLFLDLFHSLLSPAYSSETKPRVFFCPLTFSFSRWKNFFRNFVALLLLTAPPGPLCRRRSIKKAVSITSIAS